VKVTIYTSDHGSIEIADFDLDSFTALLEAWERREPVIQVNLDDGAGIAYLASPHVVRVDVD
jgi:hypothetical protein